MNDAGERDELALSFERTLSSSPEAAFEAWTDPEQVSAWWDPTGAKLVSCAIDLRPSGTFRFETQGHAPPFAGVYSVVDKPHRLVFDAMGAVGTVSFKAQGDSTLMRVTIRCASREHFEMLVKLGVEEGTAKTMDNLVAHISRRRTSPR